MKPEKKESHRFDYNGKTYYIGATNNMEHIPWQYLTPIMTQSQITFFNDHSEQFSEFGCPSGLLCSMTTAHHIEAAAASYMCDQMKKRNEFKHLNKMVGSMVIFKDGTYNVYPNRSVKDVWDAELAFPENSKHLRGAVYPLPLRSVTVPHKLV